MTRIDVAELGSYLQEWMTAPTLPLEVGRAKYDDPFPLSWEVMRWETPTCTVPIAEFTTWAEAQAFADEMSRWALSQGAWPRRWNLCYRPDGSWGGFGYWEPERLDPQSDRNDT